MSQLDLALVMPVYNEEECIADVIESWRTELDGLGIAYRMFVYNDGSKDDTAGALKRFEGNDRIRICSKPNEGHGPTILSGYKEACRVADWVFQCDSDAEMPPSAFGTLWHRRGDYDALFGLRHGRVQARGRVLITRISRAVVYLLFGPGVVDVNTPYRLMRGNMLASFVDQLPRDTFAPNIIISGEINRRGYRVLNIPVQHQPRRTGAPSIVKWKLWKSAARSLMQTVVYFATHASVKSTVKG